MSSLKSFSFYLRYALSSATEPLPIPSHSDREEVDEEGYYAGSDSEDEEWNSGRNESPLELIGNPFFSTDLGSMPPNVAQSMLAALSMSAEPAMGNEYDDEDDYPDHPEMAFAMDYDEAAALSMLVPPSQQPVRNGEDDDEDGDSTDVDMPPLAEVSDEEDASQSLESDSEEGEEDEEDEEDEPALRRPFVERAGRASLNLERDTFDAIMRNNPEMFRGLPGGPPAADEPTSPVPETSTSASVVPSTSVTPSTPSLPGPSAPSVAAPSAPSLPSPPPATENRLTSLGTGRLLSPLDLMRRTATTSPVQSPIAGPSGTIQVQTVPTEEPVVAHSPSPLRAIFRNFTLWQSPRPSPPPESSLDHVD
ncbi:hypothetical protein BC629DRAFT_311043 [Irpex lacteus]|nr:hypothetical protein BC629DRAFT_311043 [Irpex lacteus]